MAASFSPGGVRLEFGLNRALDMPIPDAET
jgi:hypothetical protein